MQQFVAIARAVRPAALALALALAFPAATLADADGMHRYVAPDGSAEITLPVTWKVSGAKAGHIFAASADGADDVEAGIQIRVTDSRSNHAATSGLALPYDSDPVAVYTSLLRQLDHDDPSASVKIDANHVVSHGKDGDSSFVAGEENNRHGQRGFIGEVYVGPLGADGRYVLGFTVASATLDSFHRDSPLLIAIVGSYRARTSSPTTH